MSDDTDTPAVALEKLARLALSLADALEKRFADLKPPQEEHLWLSVAEGLRRGWERSDLRMRAALDALHAAVERQRRAGCRGKPRVVLPMAEIRRALADGVTVAALARRYEVSPRTIFRHLRTEKDME